MEEFVDIMNPVESPFGTRVDREGNFGTSWLVSVRLPDNTGTFTYQVFAGNNEHPAFIPQGFPHTVHVRNRTTESNDNEPPGPPRVMLAEHHRGSM
ncbi:MAG: hypothetical protein FWE27_08225 [Defluviitaleaceae bacterium]|nr:hypothetical protein [Defluviitaleaceae bacterium]